MVVIFVNCKNLKASGSPPSVSCDVGLVNSRNGNSDGSLGSTENVDDCLSPSFSKSFRVEFDPNKGNVVRFRVYEFLGNETKDIGSLDISLGEIFSCGGMVQRPLMLEGDNEARGEDESLIILRVVDDSRVDESYTMKFRGEKLKKMDLFGKSDPYFFLKTKDEKGEWVELCKSETIMKTLFPQWEERKFHIKDFGYSRDSKFLFECYDWNRHTSPDFIGEVEMTVNELIQGKSFDLILKKKPKDFRGTIKCECSVTRNYRLLDFMKDKDGFRFHMITGIDFSTTSGKYEDEPHLTDYEDAIRSFGNVLCPYSPNGLFPVYGFGGQLKTTSGSSFSPDCFPVNGNPENPCCYGLDGIVNAYKRCRDFVTPQQETCLQGLIQETLDKHVPPQDRSSSKDHYVLLVITSSHKIAELQKTIDLVIEGSYRNFSILFVEMNWIRMEDMFWKGFHTKLVPKRRATISSSTKKVRKRNIITFVNFREKMRKKAHHKDDSAAPQMVKEGMESLIEQVMNGLKLDKIVPQEEEEKRIEEREIDEETWKMLDEEMKNRFEARKRGLIEDSENAKNFVKE